MNTVIKLAQDDFKIWKESNHLFTQSVNELNTKFELRGNSSLISSVPPTYFAGDLTKGKKTLVVGINPGYGEKNIQFESTIRHRDWNSYLDFHLNFFDYYRKSGNYIKYYSQVSGALASEVLRASSDRFRFCQENLVNIDLIPYHSVGFKRRKLSVLIKEYIIDRFNQVILPTISESANNIERVIIHEKHLTEIIKEKFGVNDSHQVFYKERTKDTIKVHKIKVKRTPVYLFSRFIPLGGFSYADVKVALSK